MPRTDRAVLAALLLAAPAASGDDIAWINPAGGDWHTPSNWSLGRPPTSGDRVIFGLDASYVVTTGGTAAEAGPIEQSAGDVTINLGNGTLECGAVTFANAGGPAPTLEFRDGQVIPLGVTVIGDAASPGLMRLRNATFYESQCTISGVRIEAIDGGGFGSNWDDTSVTDASVLVSGTGSDFEAGLFGCGLVRSHVVIADGATFNGDTLHCQDSTVEITGGARSAWIDSSCSISVTDGGWFSSFACGSGGDVVISGPGSAADVSGGVALVTNGGSLRTESCFWAGHATVIGEGATLVTGLVLGLSGGASVELLEGADLMAWPDGTGFLDISAPVTANGPGSTIRAGTLEIWDVVELGDGAAINVPAAALMSGELRGRGVVNGDLEHHGGGVLPLGVLAIKGALTQHDAAAWIGFDLGSSGPSGVVQSAAAALLGGLRVGLEGGYTPALGDRFEILRSPSVTGAFDPNEIVWPTPPPSLAFELEYHAGGVSILVTGCPADHDGDGELTPEDFAAFRESYLAGSPAADANGDGELTVGDFVTFRASFLAGCP